MRTRGRYYTMHIDLKKEMQKEITRTVKIKKKKIKYRNDLTEVLKLLLK